MRWLYFRCAIAGAFVVALFVNMGVAEATSAFDELRREALDPLIERLKRLEFELRIRELELCRNANCPAVSIKVSAVQKKPTTWPTQLNWPVGGLVLVALENVRSGDDDSMASEAGCKVSYNSSTLGFGSPRSSPARFLLDDNQTAVVDGAISSAQKFIQIESIVFVLMTEVYEYRDEKGLLISAKQAQCIGNPSGRYSSLGKEAVSLGLKKLH